MSKFAREFHLVDERIVGHKPRSLSAADAAALPLTSITAWELLFDRFGVVEGSGEGKCLLITGAAGGVGSMNTSSNVLVSIAVLKAKAGKELALKQELLALVELTRTEPGNLDDVRQRRGN